MIIDSNQTICPAYESHDLYLSSRPQRCVRKAFSTYGAPFQSVSGIVSFIVHTPLGWSEFAQ